MVGQKQQRKPTSGQNALGSSGFDLLGVNEKTKGRTKLERGKWFISQRNRLFDLGRPEQTTCVESMMFLALVRWPKNEQFLNRTEEPLLRNRGIEGVQKARREVVVTFLLLWSHFLFFSGAEEGDDTAIALHA